MGLIAAAVDDPPIDGDRHRIRLDGVCAVDGGPDAACTAVEISSSSLRVETSVIVKFADPVILTLPHIGILEAVVASVSEGGFDLRFDPAPRSKLGIYVAWLDDRTDRNPVDQEEREFDRLIPIKRVANLQRGGDAPSMVRIVDLSRSGVAFTTSRALAEGEHVRVGALDGRVVRLVEGGAAVRFDRLIDEEAFDPLVDLGDVASVERAQNPKAAPVYNSSGDTSNGSLSTSTSSRKSSGECFA